MPRHVGAFVGLRMLLARRQSKKPPCCKSSEREIGEEQPAPAEIRDDEPAEDGPADARGREHQSEVALKTDTLDRWDELTHERLRQRHQAAAAETLQNPRSHKLRH